MVAKGNKLRLVYIIIHLVFSTANQTLTATVRPLIHRKPASNEGSYTTAPTSVTQANTTMNQSEKPEKTTTNQSMAADITTTNQSERAEKTAHSQSEEAEKATHSSVFDGLELLMMLKKKKHKSNIM